MPLPKELIVKITRYYQEASSAYYNWGRDREREGIYALHCGYHPRGEPIEHYAAVKLLTRKVIEFAKVDKGQRVLDAGCGTGSVAFELASSSLNVAVYGINIVSHQLRAAQEFKNNAGIPNVYLSQQDYLNTAFPDDFFDRVIFCESLAHADNKKTLLEETVRLLKPKGRVVIADAFSKTEKPTNEERELIQQAREGWVLPSIIEIETFNGWLKEIGFRGIVIREATENILPSTRLMAEHAAFRLRESPQADEVITRSRKACVASDILMREGTLGYFFIRAEV